MARLADKVAIITGGGSGIGRATAALFAAEGARVVITGRREPPLAETAESIRTRGGAVHTVVADVADASACERVVAETQRVFGSPHILVNNAGIFEARGPLHETTPEAWDHMMAVNLRGPFLMTRAVIPLMLAQGGGAIVNVGSILSQVAIPNAAAYNASKGGLLMLTRSTAVEYAAQGIRCNLVCPGLTKTEITAGVWRDPEVARAAARDYPMRRFGEPAEIAHAILHLASDEASWTTGAALMVDGGATAH